MNDEGQKYYLHADLFAGEDAFVARIGLPPFKMIPDAIQWGSRHFVLRSYPGPNPKAGTVWRYHEVFCYPAPPGCEVSLDAD